MKKSSKEAENEITKARSIVLMSGLVLYISITASARSGKRPAKKGSEAKRTTKNTNRTSEKRQPKPTTTNKKSDISMPSLNRERSNGVKE
jgi:hypothetical protein